MFNLSTIDASWRPLVEAALMQVDPDYLTALQQDSSWLPGSNQVFNAFSLPLAQTRIILFGESPYPRADSANGYAFWDAAVGSLWSDSGLSKQVNRATSLRNFIKMLLVTAGLLPADNTGQAAIAELDKSALVQTGADLFQNMLQHGILLLNASLVLSNRPVNADAKAWRPFMRQLLSELSRKNNELTLLLMGNISKTIQAFPEAQPFPNVVSEHPYNVSFINNPQIHQFFKPLQLLKPLSVAQNCDTIA